MVCFFFSLSSDKKKGKHLAIDFVRIGRILKIKQCRIGAHWQNCRIVVDRPLMKWNKMKWILTVKMQSLFSELVSTLSVSLSFTENARYEFLHTYLHPKNKNINRIKWKRNGRMSAMVLLLFGFLMEIYVTQELTSKLVKIHRRKKTSNILKRERAHWIEISIKSAHTNLAWTKDRALEYVVCRPLLTPSGYVLFFGAQCSVSLSRHNVFVSFTSPNWMHTMHDLHFYWNKLLNEKIPIE